MSNMLAAALLTLACCAGPATAEEMLPFGVVIDFSAKPAKARPGGKVVLTLKLSAISTTSGITVKYRMPPQLRVLRGGSPWSGSLERGRSVSLRTTVQIIEAGEYDLGAIVEAPGGVQGAVLYVASTKQGVEIGPRRPPIPQAPRGPH